MADTKTTAAVPEAPAWAKAVIVAVSEEDKCESQTDYYATQTGRRVVLAWSRTTRADFKELRAAAGRFAETCHLASAGKDAEHRDNYSMGRGYYLKAGHRYNSGWYVQKHGLWYLKHDGERSEWGLEQGPKAEGLAAPAGAGVDGVTVSENEAKGGIEIRFPSKPAPEVLAGLKANGWRWSRFSSCWYRRNDAQARAFASNLAPNFTDAPPQAQDAQGEAFAATMGPGRTETALPSMGADGEACDQFGHMMTEDGAFCTSCGMVTAS